LSANALLSAIQVPGSAGDLNRTSGNTLSTAVCCGAPFAIQLDAAGVVRKGATHETEFWLAESPDTLFRHQHSHGMGDVDGVGAIGQSESD
jgi:hypothetical protein